MVIQTLPHFALFRSKEVENLSLPRLHRLLHRCVLWEMFRPLVDLPDQRLHYQESAHHAAQYILLLCADKHLSSCLVRPLE